MSWIEDRFRSALLFTLGALAPLAGMALLLGVGSALLVRIPGWLRLIAWPVGVSFLVLGSTALAACVATFRRPPGRGITEEEAPGLFAVLAQARQAWQGPRQPRVLLAPDAYTAELTGVPAGGIFGWCRYHWHVGVFPMLALSLREFQALVAWETIFWSDLNGWLNLQIKRLASFWYRVLRRETDRAQAGGWQPWAFVVVRWFSRRALLAFQPFLAQSFVQADRTVADAHGAATWGRALCRLAILQPLVKRRVFDRWDLRLETGEGLPEDLHLDALERLRRLPEGAGRLLELALDGYQRESPPLLRLRLQVLGVEPQAPLPPASPAFLELLAGTALAQEVEAAWRARIAEALALQEQERAAAADRFAARTAHLRGTFPDHPDAPAYLCEAFDHAPWHEFDHLLGMYRASRPLDGLGPFLAARRALQRGRDHHAAVEAEEVLRLDPLLAPACHELLAHQLRKRGDEDGADREADRGLRAALLVERIRREREGASLGDPLEPHPFAPPELREILRVCQADPRVGEAHLVCKAVYYATERPVLLLVVRMRGAWLDPLGRRRRAFQCHLQAVCPFPPEATGFVQVVGWADFLRFEGKLRKAEGLIFRR